MDRFSGTVTEYRGANYLLVTRAILKNRARPASRGTARGHAELGFARNRLRPARSVRVVEWREAAGLFGLDWPEKRPRLAAKVP